MASMNWALPKVGMATGLAVVVAAQLIGSLLMEHYGLLGATLRSLSGLRVGGAAMVAAGAYLMLKG